MIDVVEPKKERTSKKLVVFRHNGCNRAKLVDLEKSGCIRAKVAVFG